MRPSLTKIPTFICKNCKVKLEFIPENYRNWFQIDALNRTMMCSTLCVIKKRKRHKFNAKICDQDNIKFSSKGERAYYNKLKSLQQSGVVLFFLRQTPFHLPGNTKYVCDFTVFYADGTVAFVDYKGMETENFKLKKRQVEEIYGIELEIVK